MIELRSSAAWEATRAGVQPAAEAVGGSWLRELGEEADALQQIVGLTSLLLFGLALTGAVLASLMLGALARVAMRSLPERRRSIALLVAVLRVAIWTFLSWWILRRLLRGVPLLALIIVVLLLVMILLGATRSLENFGAGLGLMFRGRVVVGDRVSIAEHKGIVRRIGITRTELRNDDGDLVEIPNRLFVGEAVVIGRTRNRFPLTIELVQETGWSVDAVERVRRVATLSPYRDPDGRIVVAVSKRDRNLLEVEIQLWSPNVLVAAEQQLRRACVPTTDVRG